MQKKPLKGEEGAILITTLLLLLLMSLSGFMLLQFAGLDIRLAGSDKQSRALLYRTESCALYGVQTILNLDREKLLPGGPEKAPWIHDMDEILGDADFGLSGRRDLSNLSDREFLKVMEKMVERDLASSEELVLTLEDENFFSFLQGGSGKILVVDCGEANAGSLDLGGSRNRKYLIFTEYRDAKTQVRYLELGLLRRV